MTKRDEEAAAAAADEAGETLADSLAVEVPEERARKWRSPAFARMRTNWRSAEEREVVAAAKTIAEKRILEMFPDAYRILSDLFDIVRDAELDAEGNPKRDQNGLIIWKIRPGTGTPVEDFSRLSRQEREDFFMAITTRLVDWEARSADLWAESMFAKAAWEERFAIEYNKPIDDTIEGRTAYGNRNAADEKYFALFLTYLSRRADSVVRTMTLLAQRLKESLQI
jgi:hypothetical protein